MVRAADECNDRAVRGWPGGHLLAGGLWVVIAGLVWAAFAHQLHGDGHAPSRVLLPIDPTTYYRAQSLFILPALLVLWMVLAAVAHRLAGGAHGGPFARLAGVLGVAYGLPLCVLFVVPEWLIYRNHGIEGLRAAFPFVAPLASLTTWLAATLVLRSERGLPLTRACGVAFVALLVQALLGAPLLR